MLEDCKVKRHTTFTEAVQVASQMEAKNTILTHFSQRYSKIMPLDEFKDDAHEHCQTVGIAFDFTSVNPRTLNVIRRTFPAFEVIFEEALREVLRKKDHFKYKRFDKAVEASLNMEESFADEADENDEPKMKKAKKQFSKYAFDHQT